MPASVLARGRAAALLVAAAALATGCSTEAKKQAYYGASHNALEVVAVLRRHIPDDTYRFPAAADFTGRNVYRASLLRLENIERLHADALRAGHLDAVIAFAKGRALERLRAFDLAAGFYAEAAERESSLRAEAERSEHICRALHDSTRVGPDLSDPLLARPGSTYLLTDVDHHLAEFDERMADLDRLLEEVKGTHYEYVVREEMERADEARARYFVAMRHVLPDGNLRAVAERQRVVSRHGESKNQRRHLIELADLYAELAEEYVTANPPETLRFDPATFRELVENASRLYEAVANEDGTPEKLEAARRLEAFLAFTLKVDRDRFTP
jgi:hypothetical protein